MYKFLGIVWQDGNKALVHLTHNTEQETRDSVARCMSQAQGKNVTGAVYELKYLAKVPVPKVEWEAPVEPEKPVRVMDNGSSA